MDEANCGQNQLPCTFLQLGKGPTQTYWLHSETKEGAILKKPPDASKMLKPLFRPPRNIGGKHPHLSFISMLIRISYNHL